MSCKNSESWEEWLKTVPELLLIRGDDVTENVILIWAIAKLLRMSISTKSNWNFNEQLQKDQSAIKNASCHNLIHVKFCILILLLNPIKVEHVIFNFQIENMY